MRYRMLSLLSLLLIVGLLGSACSGAFVGVARGVDVQKAVVEDSFKQLVKLHDAKNAAGQPLVSDGFYALGKTVYATWALAETAAADALTAWKRQLDAKAAGKQPDTPMDLKAHAAATAGVAAAAAKSFIAFVKGLVNLTSPLPAAK